MIFLINFQEKIWYNKWTTLEKSSIPHPNHTFITWKLCVNTRNRWVRGRKAESQLNQCWIHSLWDWAGSEVIKFKMLVDVSGRKKQKSKECVVRWFPPGMEDTAPWLAEMHIVYNGAAVAVGVTGCDWSSTVDCRSQWQQTMTGHAHKPSYAADNNAGTSTRRQCCHKLAVLSECGRCGL